MSAGGQPLSQTEIDRIIRLYSEGKKYREIEFEVGRPIGTIKTALRRLRGAGVIRRRYQIWFDVTADRGPSRAAPRPKALLSRQQARVLRVLYDRRGNVVSRDELIGALAMRRPSDRSKRQVHIVIGKIRARLPGIRIESVHGEGYFLHA